VRVGASIKGKDCILDCHQIDFERVWTGVWGLSGIGQPESRPEPCTAKFWGGVGFEKFVG